MEMVPIFLSGLSDWFLAKRFVQHIIYFIHAQFFLEALIVVSLLICTISMPAISA